MVRQRMDLRKEEVLLRNTSILLMGIMVWASYAVADTASDYKSLFGAEDEKVSASGATGDDLAFANKLMNNAAELSAEPAFQAYLYLKVIHFAEKHPKGFDTVFQALTQYETVAPKLKSPPMAPDAWQAEKLRLYEKAYKTASYATKMQVAPLYLELLLKRMTQSQEARETQEAIRFCQLAEKLARSLRSPQLAEIQTIRGMLASDAHKEARREALQRRLALYPNKLATRKTLLLLCLIEMDDPDTAVKLSHPSLGESWVAGLTLLAENPMSTLPASQFALAEWYENVVTPAATQAQKPQALQLAIGAYDLVLANEATPKALQLRTQLNRAKAVKAYNKISPNNLPDDAVLALNFSRSDLRAKSGKTYLRDLSGSDNHALLTGVKLAPGKAGLCVVTTGGKGSVVRIPNAPSLQTTGSMTITMWICPARLGVRQNPYAKAYGGEGTMTLEKNGTINYYCGSSGINGGRSYQSMTMTAPLKVGQWAHIAVVRDVKRKAMRWFKNGKPIAESKLKYNKIKASKNDLTLGVGYAGAFKGKLDEVAIFSRALSVKEIQGLYALGMQGVEFVGSQN